MLTVHNIYPYVKQRFRNAVPDVRVDEVPFVMLGELAEWVVGQNGELDQAAVELIERFLAEGDDEVKYLACYGFLERLYHYARSQQIASETIGAALGPNATSYWRIITEMWATLLPDTVDAKLTPKTRPHPDLPADLTLHVQNISGRAVELYHQVWREDLPCYQKFLAKPVNVPFYQRYFEQLTINSSNQKSRRCPNCRTNTIKEDFQEIYLGCTETSHLSDRSEYYQFRTYTCTACRLGWSEFVRKRTWVEVSYP